VLGPQDLQEQPPRQQVREREEHLAEGEPSHALPGGREKDPRQQRRVTVRGTLIGRRAARDEACRVREDEVVDVGVLDGGVGVLVQAVEEEGEAEQGGEGEDEGGGGEGGCLLLL